MKLNLSAIALAAALAGMAVPVFAGDAVTQGAQQVISLKDGSTLYVLKDGKTAMADKYGRAARTKPGHLMEGKDGQKYIMVGDEVARLSSLLTEGHRN